MNIIQQIKQTANHLRSLIKPDQDTVIFDCGNFEITKRELITSISIVAVMLILGVAISEVIADKVEDKKRMYNQALQITTSDMFKYGMSTNVGNAFVYGKLETVDPVSYPEIKGDYLYVKKEREEYTQHERQVQHTTSDGKTYYTTEVYYTWDTVHTDTKQASKVLFLGVEFDYNKFVFYDLRYIDTIYKNSDVRYVYYGIHTTHEGTIFTKLANNTIDDKNYFYDNITIEEVLEDKNRDYSQIIFWIAWALIIIGAVYLFYYADNYWLD